MNIPYLEWNTELFDYQTDWKISCLSLIPFSCCVLQGIAVKEATLKNGYAHCLLGLLIGCGSGYNRTIIRERYHLKGDYLSDCLYSLLLCFPTAQEYREVYIREGRMRSIGRRNLKD